MTKKPIRPIRVEGNIAYITLTQGYEAIIDASDAPVVSGFHWYASVKYRPDRSIMAVYAVTNVYEGKVRVASLLLHRLLACAPDEALVDHRDTDGLNNRRSNIRIADKSQNGQNSRLRADSVSRIKGVSFWAARGKWRARIRLHGKHKTIGYFTSAAEAAAAYAEASARFHGDFGRTG